MFRVTRYPMISKTESGRVGYRKKYRVAGRVRVPAGHCMEVATANLKAPNIVKWNIPEKIMQNAFQLYWPWVNRTSHSKVMTKSLFHSWIRTRISCRCNHVDWTAVTKWSVETWFPNEIENQQKSCATLPTLQRWLLSMTYFCRLSSGSPSPSLGGWVSEESRWRSEKAAVSNNKTDKLK